MPSMPAWMPSLCTTATWGCPLCNMGLLTGSIALFTSKLTHRLVVCSYSCLQDAVTSHCMSDMSFVLLLACGDTCVRGVWL